MAATSGLQSVLDNIHDPGAKVRELVSYASQVEVEPAVPPRRYFRSGIEMLRMATVYHSEGQLESAFILYMKFITLFVEKLKQHPDYKSAPQTDINNMKRKLKDVFPLAEKIKTQLKARYTEIENKRQAEERKKQEELAKEQERLRLEEEARQKEEDEKNAKLRQESEELWLRQQEERYRELQEQERRKQKEKNLVNVVPVPVPLVPGVPEDTGLNNQRGNVPSGTLEFTPNNLRQNDTGRPKLEKNLSIENNLPNLPSAPAIPDRELKKNLIINDIPSPAVDRSSKPVDHFLSTGTSGNNKYGLKDVFIPRDTMEKFLVVARSNTLRNVETCGILAGKLECSAFHLTHVLVPRQHGTSDSCAAENEEDLFDFQDKHDLISLGWIHTHPSQTAFLSSVDMHTHYPYQLMMPEAVAIVCSPKFNETGIFMLTPDRGLPEVSKCRQKGFHEHTKVPPLFEDCSHGKLVDNRSIAIVDLQ